jgi:lipopolysaccharide/colanic/teichoic acid biosynthesis glycosyltransferase
VTVEQLPGQAGGAAPPAADGVPLALTADPRAPRAVAIKRAIDVVGSAVALVACSPVMGLIAVAVRRQSPGPALFRQDRVGRGGRLFTMLKFRTMVMDAEQERSELLARSSDPDWLHLADDPRITPLGRLLRRTSLDELPQLWNVLRGDMSLVGPRPLVPAEDARVGEAARLRRHVAPGITGSWQVSGRTAIPFQVMLALDAQYVATWSLRRDLAIMLRTIPVVLSGEGAN